jgi:hypothetical protein
VLDHPANKRVDIHGFVLHSLSAVGPVMVRHPVAIIAINQEIPQSLLRGYLVKGRA